ncbi:FxDxF family PEP-CTERM protein [Methylobacillus gramineus]|uniref:FxDxF family PEP-CTERM protein n=1 Tax=Methylobacillus gramineus TaxID=755169 RepID=UPI001CFFDA2F|nr:FxDxF family PEP-CTERM protein [Methylobacillus gramineus]MCB5183812.1 FxDxF family PEP-CTERM protein [Methylobacillus gramineus]
MIATSFKAKAVALAFGFSMFSAVTAFAATAPLTIINGQALFGNNFSVPGDFSDTWTFTLTDATDIGGTASSTYLTIGSLLFSGVDLTSVTLASSAGIQTDLTYNFPGGSSTTNTWKFSVANLAAGSYTLTVAGVAGLATITDAQASYGGNLTFTAAVPEPETYGMLALGLGLVGFAARRRQNNVKFF